MATQRSTASLPALTAAHQQQFRLLLDSLTAQGHLAEGDVVLLKHLAGDLPKFRSYLPAEMREALQDLDQNEVAIKDALAGMREAVGVFQVAPEESWLPAPRLLDVEFMAGLAQQAQVLAQAAAELALRSQQRAEMLRKYGKEHC
jgi:hypothetical protein